MENKNFTIIYKDGKVINQNTLTSVKQLVEMEGLNINIVVNNLNNEILVDTTKIESTLVQCDMVEDITSIEFNMNYVTTDLGEYLVFDNYEDAENLAIERNIEILEDCGIPENLIFEAELQGLIDTEYFEDYFNELHQFEAYDEGLEYIITDEQDELLEAGEITEQDIRDNLYNSLQASIKGNELEEYKFQFGEDEFQRVLIEHDLIDITALAKWCVDMDGIGHTLASYDGDETECNGYYIYRTN